MNKKKTTKPAVLIVLILIFSVFLGIIFYNHASSKLIKITNREDGTTITINKNDSVEVTLTNPGDGGFLFDEPSYDKKILKQISHNHINPTSQINGDFGNDVWTFRSLNKGKTNLIFGIHRGDEKEKYFSVVVNVN